MASLRTMPVFPLPQAVLFPGVVLPLHIFEARYHAMVRDSLASHRSLVLSMVQPGCEQQATPSLCSIGCMGRIIHAEATAKNRYNILVQGQERVRLLHETTANKAYRCFHTEIIAPPSRAARRAAHLDLMRLQSGIFSLARVVAAADKELLEVLRSTACPVELIDILAAVLVREPWRQQHLLATLTLSGRLYQLIDSLADMLWRYRRFDPSYKPHRHQNN